MRANTVLDRSVLRVFVVPIWLYASALYAEPQWDFSMEERATYQFNANRSSLPDAELDEFQLSSNLAINGEIGQGSTLAADVGYRLEHTDYSKETQDSNLRWEGTSNIVFGEPRGFYELLISHERNQLLRSPSQEDLRSNQEDRDTFGAKLTFRTNPKMAGWVELSIERNGTKFNEFELNDTDRSSVDLQFLRSISPLSRAGVGVTYSSVAYKYNSLADYDISVFYVNYQRALRNLEYSVAIGSSAVSSELRESSSPYLQASVVSTFSGTIIQFNASSVVVDNSSVNRLTLDDSITTPLSSLNNGNLLISDQIHRTAARFALTNTALCRRCTLNFQTDYIENKYQNQKSEDLENTVINMGLRYLIAQDQTLTVQLRQSHFSFPNSEQIEFVDNGGGLFWSYSATRRLIINALLTVSERNLDGAGSYSTKGFGVGFRYTAF